MKNGKTVAIVPGSFDPITYGHLDIIKRASELYDRVYVAVMINVEKKYLFELEEREEIARSAVMDIDNVTVVSSSGMLWKLAEKLCADAIVKGYRNQTDYNYEMNMAEYNSKYNPKAKTVLLKASDGLRGVSSTVVRENILNGNALDQYLPPLACETLKEILGKKKLKS